MFSRLQTVSKIIDSTKFVEAEEKQSLGERNYNFIPLDASNYGFFNGFVPPPPRMPSIKDIVSDGLTTCDSCIWASMHDDKSFFSSEGFKESSSKNDISWIVILLSVSFCSALFGAIVMILTLRFKRNSSIGAFMFEKQGVSSTANLDGLNSKLELKKIDESSNNDLTFFMEQEEDLYATLDDHDSISSENINSFNKTTYLRTDENDVPHFSSNPSSAYYSDLSNHNEKAYENIESFNMDRTTDIITINRLSAISENNSGSRINCNSEYV